MRVDRFLVCAHRGVRVELVQKLPARLRVRRTSCVPRHRNNVRLGAVCTGATIVARPRWIVVFIVCIAGSRVGERLGVGGVGGGEFFFPLGYKRKMRASMFGVQVSVK